MGAWDKLTAVNRVLRAAGENPVSTLATTAGDALLAEAILDEVNYEVQCVGLTVNTEEQELEPDVDSHIQFQDTVLHVQVLDEDDLIIMRGRTPQYLYNSSQNTDEFEDNIRARITYGLEFEELPFPIQLWITDEAARRYQHVAVGDAQSDQLLREVWMQSRARGRASDIRSRAASIFGAWASRLPYRAKRQTMRGTWR